MNRGVGGIGSQESNLIQTCQMMEFRVQNILDWTWTRVSPIYTFKFKALIMRNSHMSHQMQFDSNNSKIHP